jgi:hypothetical protein
MVIETGTPKPGSVGTAILDQLADLDLRSLSPEAARAILQLRFDASQHERLSILSVKAQEGTLTLAEQDELDESIRVADLLAILQSKARQALKNAGLAP